jgi:hypothetical protein
MFFANINNIFFIKEDELEYYSFKEVLENRNYNIEFFEKGFEDVDINFDLSMIDFLRKLFNFDGILDMKEHIFKHFNRKHQLI